MWFEGQVRPDNVPKLLNDLMTSSDAKGTPMWEMVSSRIGTLDTDDGYIFKSRGESGKDTIFLGINPAYGNNNDSLWYDGHYFSMMEDYVPGAPGQNGIVTRRVRERGRYHHDGSYGGVTKNTIMLRYYISVTRDRVIVMLSNQISSSAAQSVRSIMYMGLMKRYSEEPNSTACCIATTYGSERNNYNYVYVQKNADGRPEGYTIASDALMANNYAARPDGKFPVYNIPLQGLYDGIRGEIDGILVAPYYTSTAYQNSAPEDGTVIIDGKEYVAARKKYYHGSRHDHFGSYASGNVDFIYYIEKK